MRLLSKLKALLISIMFRSESDESYNTEMQSNHGARKKFVHGIAMDHDSNQLSVIKNEDDEIQFGEQYDGTVNVSKLEDVCSTDGCSLLKKLKYEYSLLSSSVVPHWRNSYKGLKQSNVVMHVYNIQLGNVAMESTNGSPAVIELPCTPEFLPFWDKEHFFRKLNKYEIFSNLNKDEKMILKFCIEKLTTDFLRKVISPHGGFKGDEWISFMKKYATVEITEKLKAQLNISVYISNVNASRNDKIKGRSFTERKIFYKLTNFSYSSGIVESLQLRIIDCRHFQNLNYKNKKLI
ncbi:hypothetical protein T03_12591 [Trichinella britovi]|uniref:PiggyBac transposable element-derived protein domain-containing protein n=1 Tax=Trichinella britovi TaxID=45882 RepID=A0A0V1DA54_TRIBR|nr:hypothetical protein T03_12591 [Trichinella britovi]